MDWEAPYDGLSEKDIHSNYSKVIFPETKSLDGLGSIIAKCWQGQYLHSKISH